jgi:hypothetical protein
VGVGLAHKKPVYAVRWAPTGEGSANAGKVAMLARCVGRAGRGIRRACATLRP